MSNARRAHSRLSLESTHRWLFATLAFFALSLGSTFTQAQDLARLANPDVADRVGLDDAQRAALQRLIQTRATEVAANPEERNAITQRFQEAARALLTDSQWELFNGAPATAPLRFNFREESWPEVLQWFARQNDSSLVMDAVPDGSFTYADDRSYSPAEAIDLINSVLLTKGYTIIRRNKLMTLVRLGEVIPLELIPKVDLEDLPSLGRFEMVAVEFSIGNRSMEAVLSEVTPYLGSFGRAVPLPQSRRLLVVEAAGKMETINVLIASVPGPPPERPPAPKPPDPTFATYSLGPLDPQATLETLKGLISSERLTVDEKTRVLSAFVVPDQHSAIQRYLDELIAKQTERGAPQLAVYKTTLATANAIKEQVEASVPGAVARVDEATGHLLVTGDSEALQAVDQLLRPLGLDSVGGTPASDDSVLKIHRVAASQVTPLATLLSDMLPSATIYPDDTNGQLVVRASLEEQQKIEALVQSFEQLQTERQPVLRRITSPEGLDATRMAQIAALVPSITAELDAESRSIFVTGPALDQERFVQLLEQWQADAPATQAKELQSYEVSDELRARLLAIQTALPNEFPSLTILEDSRPGQLSVVAPAETHAKISQWLDRLKADIGPPVSRSLKVYPITPEQRPLAISWLADQMPQAQLQEWADEDSLLIAASPQDHEAFAAWLAELTTQLPQQESEVLVAYPLEHADPTEMAPLLERLIGSDEFVIDTAGRQIVVVATLEQHAKIKAALTQVDRPEAATAEQVLDSYDLGGLNGATVVAMITPIWPKMRLALDASTGRLIAWGTPLEHQELRSTLEKLLGADGGPNRTIAMIPIEAGDLTSLPAILRQLAPGALLSIDPISRTLSVWGTEQEQQRIADAVKQLGSVAQERQELKLYPIARERGTKLVSSLATLFPTLKITLDDRGTQLIVLASSSEQTRVAEILEQVEAGADDGPQSQMQVYRLEQMTGVAFTTFVTQLAPQATVILASPTGPAAVWASQEDHEKLRQGLEGIEGSLDQPDDQTQLLPYQIPDEQAATFPTLLARLRPTATIISGSGSSELVIADSQAGHEQLQKWVESLKQLSAQTDRATLQSHPVRPDLKTTVVASLTATEPTIRWIANDQDDLVVAWGSASEHEAIRLAIERLQQEVVAPAERVLQRYEVAGIAIDRLKEVITATLPEVDLIDSANLQQLVAWGTAKEHEQIATIVTQMRELAIADPQTLSRVVAWKTTSLSSLAVVTALTGLIPESVEVRPIASAPAVIIVSVDAQLLEQTAEQVEQIAAELTQTTALETRAFRLENVDPQATVQVLRAMMPTRSFTADPQTRQVAATAEPEELDQIQVFLQQFDIESIAGDRTTRLYQLKQGSTRGLGFSLSEMLPEAVIYGDRETNLLVATATEEEHEQIKAVVEQFESLNALANRETRVFVLQRADAGDIEDAIEALTEDASISADGPTNSLIVTATKEELEQIASVVTQIEEGRAQSLLTKAYPVARGEPSSLRQAIEPLLDHATVTADDDSGILLVTASESDHEQVSRILEDLSQAPVRGPTFKAYPLEFADVESVAESLQDAMPRSRSLGISFDLASSTLLVVAEADDHATIAKMIENIDRPRQEQRDRQMKVFSLYGIDGESVSGAVEALFDDAVPPVDVRYDQVNEQLVVVGNREQLTLVEETIAQLDPPQREFEIFELRRNEPSSVVLAINRLFEDLPSNEQPSTSTDSSTGQLFVRGTREQMDEIRDLLNRLGESVDATGDALPSLQRIRTIPSSARMRDALERVREVWPSIRSNPIQILGPAANDEDRDSSESAPFDSEATGSKRIQTETPLASSQEDPVGDQPVAPIVLIPGGEQWTIASDDLPALDQFVELLEAALSQGTAYATAGNFSIHLLENAGAEDVAETLNDIYRRVGQGRTTTTLGRVAIVPDARINALIVNASRADRAVVEELIAVLDSKELMQNLQAPVPQLVPLFHADATRIQAIIATVYKSQLSSGGGRRAIPIPEGVPPEVASVLQQVNAAASAPLLTVEADEATNSLIVRGPDELVEELQEFVTRLDDRQLQERGNRVEVIQLQGTNGERMQDAIRSLMRSGARGR